MFEHFFIDRQHIGDLEFSDLDSKDLISVPKCHHQPIQYLIRCITSRHDFKITSWFETSCKTLIKRERIKANLFSQYEVFL